MKLVKGLRVTVVVPGVVDATGDIILDPHVEWSTTDRASYIDHTDVEKFAVSVQHPEIRQGVIYKDEDGTNYIGSHRGHVHDGARYLGPDGAGPLPDILIEVT